ncbi:unnamed protein product, partial [Nesidiocoris tenuis]
YSSFYPIDARWIGENASIIQSTRMSLVPSAADLQLDGSNRRVQPQWELLALELITLLYASRGRSKNSGGFESTSAVLSLESRHEKTKKLVSIFLLILREFQPPQRYTAVTNFCRVNLDTVRAAIRCGTADAEIGRRPAAVKSRFSLTASPQLGHMHTHTRPVTGPPAHLLKAGNVRRQGPQPAQCEVKLLNALSYESGAAVRH